MSDKCYSSETNWCETKSLSQSYDKTNGNSKRKEKIKVRNLVNRFFDETTIHGIRYIGNRELSIYIRLLWLVIFLACAGLMAVQIVERILHYAGWPVTVDVRINYNSSLSFPALTICNQNAFKTTATDYNGQYNLIEDMFSGNVSTLEKYTQWRNATLQQLNIDNGHRREDMVIQCKWAGQKCKNSWLSTTITDHGRCFTFNGPQTEDIFTVSASGARSGLKLLLNIEQYEYMPGPHEAAGLKVLLHEPNEFPFIGELGKALQVGTHTFIGIQLLQLHNLGRPHGHCDDVKLKYLDNYTHTLTTCRTDCNAQILLKKCGCLDFYFPLTEGYRLCTVEDVPCLFSAKDELRRKNDYKCYCPVPCDSNHFESEISFGSISNFALHKMMRKINIKKVETSFVHAREISQRLWKHVAKKFEEIVSNLEQHFLLYRNKVDNMLRIAVHDSYNNLKYVYNNTYKHWAKKRYYYKFQDYVLRKNILRGRDAYEERYLRYVAANPYGFGAYIKDVFNSFLNSTKNRTQSCENTDAFVNVRASIASRLDVAREGYIHLTKIINSFENGTSIFNYKFYRNSRTIGRKMLPKVMMKFALRRNWNARNYGLNTVNSIQNIVNCLEEYLNVTDNVFESSKIDINVIKKLNEDFANRCKKFFHDKSNLYTETVDWTFQELTRRIHLFEDKWNKFDTIFNEMEINFLSYLNSIHEIKNNLSSVKNSIELAQRYRNNRSITKKHLYDNFQSPDIAGVPGFVNSFKAETYSRTTSLTDHWKTLSESVQEIWETILIDPDMKEYYEYTNKSEYLVNSETFIKGIQKDFTRYVQANNFDSIVGSTDVKFLESYKRIVDHLVEFVNSLHIGESFIRDNFLKLEIFYRELSFEDIQQQPAYGIFALLCDIGGSMGLFIGASFMSIFEFIDLLCHIMITKNLLRGRRVNRNLKSQYSHNSTSH